MLGAGAEDAGGGVVDTEGCWSQHPVGAGEAHVEPEREAVERRDVLGDRSHVPLREGEVFLRAAVKVQVEELADGTDDGGDGDGADSSVLIYMSRECSHVEAVDVIPKADFVLLIGWIVHGGDADAGFAWEHQAAWTEEVVASPEHGVKHCLVEKCVAHPFGDDDVDHGDIRCCHVFHSTMDTSDYMLA